ncbi:hypothetical protein GCM10023214_57080 [Amycolatopsis dongchuanensis]|uniref:Uncharacterized protein n=1 Tax=Amycolatopsis dongchuanensis TaxID=1070866 RepID=A0ABP8VBR0_9PSEU
MLFAQLGGDVGAVTDQVGEGFRFCPNGHIGDAKAAGPRCDTLTWR